MWKVGTKVIIDHSDDGELTDKGKKALIIEVGSPAYGLNDKYIYVLRGLDDSFIGGHWAESELRLLSYKKESTSMSKKYYRVIKDTPAWKQGAIIEENDDGYKAINDLWDGVEDLKDYEETTKVVENASDFFERVYAMGKAQKMVFVTKEKAQELASKYFTGE